MFKDYVSTYDENRQNYKRCPKGAAIAYPDLDISSWQTVYKWELDRAMKSGDPFHVRRLLAEAAWYDNKRPYFNVYPLIERKLLELNSEIDLNELSLPFVTIEVRTTRFTVLFSQLPTDPEHLFYVIDFRTGGYQEFIVNRTTTISAVLAGKCVQLETGFNRDPNIKVASDEMRQECVYLAAGVCLLANDKSIVSPVVLNNDRRDNMTPAEIAKYAEKALKRTGKRGFDVGRDIERMKATAHYRNGCFAKYHVGPDHECYPPNSESRLVPIIKWRSGAVVNKDNLPTVPTGYHDATI